MDLVKAIEADLFGAHEWAADLLAEAASLTQAAIDHPGTSAANAAELQHEAQLLAWRAARNAAAVVQAAVDADAEGKPAAVTPPPPSRPAAPIDALSAAREALYAAPREARVAAAGEFAAEYEAQGGTTVDAVLVALCLSNVSRREHARAAELYETAADEFERRAHAGVLGWRESAKSCWFRAAVAHRLAGEESKARAATGAADRLGGPGVAPGAFGDRETVRKL
ncbi:MAG: hypothetical protein ACYDDF_13200 [Thermoplasmatota archaeon]